MRKHEVIPDDDRRCQHTTIDGRRCRNPRLEGDQTLCWPHYDQAASRSTQAEPHPAFVAQEILPPGQSLDTAQAVNATLTRVFRCLLEGRISPAHAARLGYVGQLIISTLPGMQREAGESPAHKHPILGGDPDAAIAQLAHSLQRSLAAAVPAATATATIPAPLPDHAPASAAVGAGESEALAAKSAVPASESAASGKSNGNSSAAELHALRSEAPHLLRAKPFRRDKPKPN